VTILVIRKYWNKEKPSERVEGIESSNVSKLQRIVGKQLCCAPLKLWTGGLVSWVQQTHLNYSRTVAVEDSRRSLTDVTSECAVMFPVSWGLEAA